MYQTPEAAIEYLAGQLPAAPSPGLRQMVTDLMAVTEVPLGFERLSGSYVGAAKLGPAGTVLSLADVSLDEGVVGHELAAAILETRGWPCFFGAEPTDMWVGRIQKSLASLLDHACGIRLQRQYGIACDAYEKLLLDKEEEALQQLLANAAVLNSVDLSAEKEIESGIRMALMAVERLWRSGSVPAEYISALDLFPGAQSLFMTLSDLAPSGPPMQGWPARELMGQIIQILDDYMEIKGEVRPLMILSHFVPAIHPDDAEQALGNVTQVVYVPLQSQTPGEYSFFLLPQRDSLPFGFRQAFADDEARQGFLDRLIRARYGDFCRTLVPEDFRFWTPEGPSQLATVQA
jgi:hypothetical protein